MDGLWVGEPLSVMNLQSISRALALPLRGLIGREATVVEARMGQGRGDGRVAIGCACGHLGARR